MTDIFGPRSQTGHPDRFLDCQEAIEAAFASLAEQAVAAGCGKSEVAAALVYVADCHMLPRPPSPSRPIDTPRPFIRNQ
jgi:hypothetical protein